MTPKEKAEELVDKFVQYTPADSEFEYPYAKKCALIAVDEIISLNIFDYYESDWSNTIEYWQEVKQELEKL
jgi:hypothetical protein